MFSKLLQYYFANIQFSNRNQKFLSFLEQISYPYKQYTFGNTRIWSNILFLFLVIKKKLLNELSSTVDNIVQRQLFVRHNIR